MPVTGPWLLLVSQDFVLQHVNPITAKYKQFCDKLLVTRNVQRIFYGPTNELLKI